MNKRLILFNGPPRAGKDTAAEHVWNQNPGAQWFRMSAPLKDGVRAIFNLNDEQARVAEAQKDAPLDMFFGRTYRDVQISLSEQWMKEQFGVAVFGHIAARKLASSLSSLFVCSDSGFAEEAAPLVKLIGHRNVLLVRIHRLGCDFSNDSRSYITLPDVRTLNMYNNGSRTDMHAQLDEVVKAWLSM